ncbi:Dihydropteroate synthase [Desulfonema limicola]|uniref:Dihydropteroate synthase n=1 Tax=Desulfonema limicola TaxID=45656 RepID=A0A975B591_9BACT|nr:methyltetrahydrofolate cobalamin methyltransferase [Desulfonema limicola]QTA78984.1 Dihydropteroate synthase [Desulfonema limicola]
MIIIGELINSSRKAVADAIENKDAGIIQKLSKDQDQAGADYIDINAGTFVGRELECMKWLLENVQKVTDKPCTIDSPDPNVIQAALEIHKGIPMINSISLEKERYDKLMPIIAGTDIKVIALCMSDEGMPTTMEDRQKIADKLVNGLVKNNVNIENIFIDPLVQPISVNKEFGMEFLCSIENIMKNFKGIHTVCGLSNISYGLPARKVLNRAFMTMAVSRGLDAAIIDPLDKKMMRAIIAAQALSGQDDFCVNYLQAYRSGMF